MSNFEYFKFSNIDDRCEILLNILNYKESLVNREFLDGYFANKVYMVGEDLKCRQIELSKAYRISCYNTNVHRFVRKSSSGNSIGGVYQDYYFKIDQNNTGLLRPAKEKAVYEFYSLLFGCGGSSSEQQALISKTELLIYANLPILLQNDVSGKITTLISNKFEEIKKSVKEEIINSIKSEILRISVNDIKNLEAHFKKSNTFKQVLAFINRKDINKQFKKEVKEILDIQLNDLQNIVSDEKEIQVVNLTKDFEETKAFKDFINFDNGITIEISELLKKEINDSLTQEIISIQASQLQNGETLESLLMDIYGKPHEDMSHQEYQRNCNKRLEESIDIYSFSSHIIASLLLNTTDYKADNLIVNKDSKFIVGIDNDNCLDIDEFEEINGISKINFRNILFTLTPLMSKSIDKKCIDQIKSINPCLIILKWLFSIYKRDINYSNQIEKVVTLYKTICNINDSTEIHKILNNIKNCLGIPIELKSGFVSNILSKLLQIQNEIINNSSITHFQLFKKISPLSSICYEVISGKTPSEQMNYIYDKPHAIKKMVNDRANNQMNEQDKQNKQEYSQEKEMISIKEAIISIIKEFKPNGNLNQFIQFIQLLLEISKEFKNDLTLNESLLTSVNESLLLIVEQSEPNINQDLVVNFLDLIKNQQNESSLKLESTIYYLISNSKYSNDEPKLISLLKILVKYGTDIDYSEPSTLSTPLGIALSKNMIQLFIELVNLGAGKSLNYKEISIHYHKLDSEIKVRLIETITKLTEINPKFGFQIALNHLFPSTDISDKKRVIFLSDYENRYVANKFWNQLFDEQGLPKKTNQYGTRSVPFISDGIHGIYIKFNPQIPGTDIAVTILGEKLFGYTSPYSELAIINDYPVLLIHEVKGKTLYDILKQDPTRLDKLDAISISKLILLEILVNNGDGNLGNIIINKSNKIYSIDNEQCFMPPVAKMVKNGMFSQTASLQVETSIFLFNQMNHIVPKEVVKCIIDKDLIQLLKSWLKELKEIHQKWLLFFSKKGYLYFKKLKQLHNNNIEKSTIIGIVFAKGEIKRFFSKLLRLETILGKSSITHFQVLDLLEPQVSIKYKNIIRSYNNKRISSGSNNRFFELYEDIKKSNELFLKDYQKFSLTESKYTSTQVLYSLAIPNANSIQESLREGQYSPENAIQELKEIETQHSRILKILKDLNKVGVKKKSIFQIFSSFTSFENVTEAMIEKILKMVDFFELSEQQQSELMKCISKKKLRSVTFRNSANNCIASPMISNLRLKYIVVLNLINHDSFWFPPLYNSASLVLPVLIKLKIENCKSLGVCKIKALNLKIFTAIKSSFKEFTLKSPVLEEMNLLDGTFDDFDISALAAYKYLSKLDISSYRNQKFRNSNFPLDLNDLFFLDHVGSIRDIIINKSGEKLIKHVKVYIYGDNSDRLMKVLSGHSKIENHYKNYCFHPILNSNSNDITSHSFQEVIINLERNDNYLDKYFHFIYKLENISSILCLHNQSEQELSPHEIKIFDLVYSSANFTQFSYLLLDRIIKNSENYFLTLNNQNNKLYKLSNVIKSN